MDIFMALNFLRDKGCFHLIHSMQTIISLCFCGIDKEKMLLLLSQAVFNKQFDDRVVFMICFFTFVGYLRFLPVVLHL